LNNNNLMKYISHVLILLLLLRLHLFLKLDLFLIKFKKLSHISYKLCSLTPTVLWFSVRWNHFSKANEIELPKSFLAINIFMNFSHWGPFFCSLLPGPLKVSAHKSRVLQISHFIWFRFVYKAIKTAADIHLPRPAHHPVPKFLCIVVFCYQLAQIKRRKKTFCISKSESLKSRPSTSPASSRHRHHELLDVLTLFKMLSSLRVFCCLDMSWTRQRNKEGFF